MRLTRATAWEILGDPGDALYSRGQGSEVNVSNRDLVVMATAAFVMAACAVLMTVNAVPGRAPAVQATTDTVAVFPEVVRRGGAPIDPQGPLIVRVVGAPPKSVLLTCDMFKAQRAFEGNVAWFSSLPLGDCALALEGSRPWQPVYPGDDLRCSVKEGATVCTGGLATSRAARLTVESAIPADLFVDDLPLGPLPVRDHSLRVGQRALRLAYPDGRFARYALVVEPDQTIRVTFPVPAGMASHPLPASVPKAPPPPPRPAVGDGPAVPPVADEDTGGGGP